MSATAQAFDELRQAAISAGQAPSLHNSQPWHWVVGRETLELRLERRRVLRAADPNARLAILSCGVALHHAMVHLAAQGWWSHVTRIDDRDNPGLLARLRLLGRGSVDHDAARLAGAVPLRHTDRRAVPGAPLDLHRVRAVRHAVDRHGAGLVLLRPHQIFALADAVETAQAAVAADPGRQAEIAAWVGGHRPRGAGIPGSALPRDPSPVTAPARTLRRAGSALIAESHHHAAVFAVLRTARDDRIGWLLAGEGLSAGWLTATVLDVAVLPLSVVTEVAGSRDLVRGLLGWTGYPHLVLRLAAGTAGQDTPATPRLAPAEVVTVPDPSAGPDRPAPGPEGPAGPAAAETCLR